MDHHHTSSLLSSSQQQNRIEEDGTTFYRPRISSKRSFHFSGIPLKPGVKSSAVFTIQ
jgi:hypothetical protein